MSLYVHATIKIKPGKLFEAYELLGRIVPEMEKGGWKLLAAYQGLIGQTSTLVDIWEVADANAVPALMASMGANPKLADIGPKLLELMAEEEFLQLMVKAPYSP
jgi:NIPSNAP